MSDIAHPSRTRAILKKYRLSPKKSLGKNFLIDANILKYIVRTAEIDAHTGVIEIGPGIGALTEHLARAAERVLAFEIDRRLIPVLQENLAAFPHVQIIHQDVLEADLKQFAAACFERNQPLSVVANLPYYVTTPILIHVLESGIFFRHMVVMVQKEVARRLTAQPGSKDYGSLSILVQYYTACRYMKLVPKTVFIPQPNVDSAIVKLSRREAPPVRVDDESFFFRLIRASFAMRRKTLINNLLAHFLPKEDKPALLDALAQVEVDGNRRAESLSMAEFARISQALKQKLQG